MRILQLNPAFYPATSYGGTITASYNLTKALARRGHDVTVFTSDTIDERTRQKGRYIEHEGLKIHYFKNLSNTLAWHRFFFYPGLILALKNQIQSFDVVHLHDTRNFQNIVAVHYAKKYGIPYFVQPHGSLPRIIEKKNLKKLYDVLWGNDILKYASKVIAVSETEVEQFRQAGIPQSKIAVVPNGVDDISLTDLPIPGKFREQQSITEKHIILYVGRIHKRKGIDFLIRAYKLFLQTWTGEDVILIIGGPDDGYRSILETLVEQLGVADKVRFIGFIPSLVTAYQDADVLVYPSTYEIFGLVPFEALLCGTPAIVTDDCGCGEIIKNARCGHLVHYGDEAGLSEVLRYVLTHPEENKEMVESGRRYIEEYLVWDSVVKQMEKTYERTNTQE
jgi:glycosyltransferase involved in cell wall biosynthesis